MTNRLIPIGGEICPSSTKRTGTNAEEERVNAVARQYREDQRDRNDDHPQAFDQAAEHGVENEESQKEFKPAQLQANDECRYLLADAGEADGIGEI